jgi:hypothetical protein
MKDYILEDGETVYLEQLEGVVKIIGPRLYPVEVTFTDGNVTTYTLDGKYNCNIAIPALSRTPYTVVHKKNGGIKLKGFSTKKAYVPKKGELILVGNNLNGGFLIREFIKVDRDGTILVSEYINYNQILKTSRWNHFKEYKPQTNDN